MLLLFHYAPTLKLCLFSGSCSISGIQFTQKMSKTSLNMPMLKDIKSLMTKSKWRRLKLLRTGTSNSCNFLMLANRRDEWVTCWKPKVKLALFAKSARNMMSSLSKKGKGQRLTKSIRLLLRLNLRQSKMLVEQRKKSRQQYLKNLTNQWLILRSDLSLIHLSNSKLLLTHFAIFCGSILLKAFSINFFKLNLFPTR